MSIKTLAIRGVVFNWLGRGCSLVIVFFLTPYLVHTLGDERYGLWSIVMTFAGYYALADMGLRGAGTKYIAQFHAVDDHESINKVVVTSLVVYAGMAVIMLAVVSGVAWFFPLVFDTGAQPVNEMRWIVLLTGFNFSFRLLGQIYGATLTALQRFDLSNGLSVTSQLTQAVAVVAALYFGHGLVGMAWAMLAVGATTNIARFVIANRLLHGVHYSMANVDRETFKIVFRFGGVSFLNKLGNRTVGQLGPVIVGLIVGPAAVAYYAIAQSLASKSVEAVSSSIRTVVFPLASSLESQGRNEALVKVLTLGSKVLISFALSLTAIYIVMGRTIISVWIDAEHSAQSFPLLCILIVAFAVNMSSYTQLSILRGTGRLSVISICSAVNATLILLLGPLLTWQFGAIGMAWTFLIATIVRSVLIIPWSTCRALEISFLRFLREVIPPATIAAFPALVLSYTISIFFPAQRLLILVPQMLLIGAATALSTFLFCLGESERVEIAKSFRLKRRPKSVSVSDATLSA